MSEFNKKRTEGRDAEFHTATKSEGVMKHFHKNYEIIIVVGGSCVCTVNDQQYRISEGDAFLICPLQLHEFALDDKSLVRVINFNDNLILTVSQSINGKVPENPIYRLDQTTKSLALRFFDEAFGADSGYIPHTSPYEKRIRLKGILYLLMASYLDNASLIDAPHTDTVAMDVAVFIADNYQNNISLKDIALAKGYNYQYLSRTFNKYMNINFKKMLNHYRIQRAHAMLQDTDEPISYVGFECGFQSVRSFNQVCRDFYGMTPKEIRHSRRL